MLAVWFHGKRMDWWAVDHVRDKHNVVNEDIVHIEVEIPKSWLRRHASGIFYSKRDIPPSRIRKVRVVRCVVETLIER